MEVDDLADISVEHCEYEILTWIQPNRNALHVSLHISLYISCFAY